MVATSRLDPPYRASRGRRWLAAVGMPLGLGAGFAVLGAGAGPTLVLSAVGTIAVGGLRAVISDAVF